MRLLMQLTFPLEPFNSYAKDGSAGARIAKAMEAIKPEAAYFTEQDGNRGAVIIVNVEKDSDIPKIAEPFFLGFNANVQMRICMKPEDLAASGLDELGKQWA